MVSNKGNVFVVGLDEAVRRMWYNAGYNIILGDMSRADIVCFIGGFDINPELYHETKNTKARVSVSPSDDKRDVSAWNIVPEGALKVGICRGAQFLHVMNGGKLYQHVSGHASSHRTHDTIWKKEIMLTSSHHQQMIPTSKSNIFAYAEGIGSDFTGEFGDMAKPDHEAEIIWYEDTKSLCVQSHPEWKDRNTDEYEYFFNLINLVR